MSEDQEINDGKGLIPVSSLSRSRSVPPPRIRSRKFAIIANPSSVGSDDKLSVIGDRRHTVMAKDLS